MPVLPINDLRGGESDEHPATILENQVAEAQNVDWWKAFVAGRRNGSDDVITALLSELTALIVYTPNSASTNDRLWSLNEAGEWVSYDAGYAPTTHAPSPADVFLPANGANGASLHGKLFLAAKTTDSGAAALSRLHVFDGTTLRRAGLAPPAAAPNVTNTGAGTFSGTRYYRVRYIEKSGSTILRRSEPSSETTFVPSGTGLSARITKPAAVDEGETDWEVEESINNADWYRIATVAVGTTTYDDSLATTVVATSGTLSDDIGDYEVQESYRYLAVDRDRLVGFGNHEDPTKDSDVVWTPVGNDTSGVGNDERVPRDTGNRVRLDGQDGGPITAGASFDGRVIAYKEHRIYSLTQTGQRQSAYIPQPASRTYGAIKGSVIEAVDQAGRPALYSFDSKVGPVRMGAMGVEVLCPQLQAKLLTEINFTASTVVSNVVYHADRGQVWWHLAGTGEDTPSFRWVYDVKSGGSSFHTLPNNARAAVLWIGKPHITADGGLLVKCDVEGATDDYGNAFRAFVRTRAYELGALIGRFGVKAAMVEGDAATVTLTFKLVRDYGLETASVTFMLTAAGSEDYVIKSLDNARISEASSFQIEIGDAAEVSVTPWQLHRIVVKWDKNGENV